MNILDSIAIRCGTDKATQHPVLGHGYTTAYHFHFGSLQDKPVRLLEIGVGGGESVRMWLEYFPHGEIHGVDIVQDTNPWNAPGKEPDSRYHFLQGNQSDPTMWKCAVANWGGDFDIIVDDGSHMSGDIAVAFECLWPILKSGGYYCIEDLGVDEPTSVFFTPGTARHHDWLGELMRRLNRKELAIDWIEYSRELAVIKKA